MIKWFVSSISVFKDLGIDIILFIAGIAGGIALMTKSSNLNRMQKFMTVLSGGFAANYLTPLVGLWLNLNNEMLYGIGFLIGYGGLKSVESIFLLFQKKVTNDSN